jgi:hypothetical protein
MIERTEARFGLKPERLAADTAYGSAPMLNWLVEEKKITPHIASSSQRRSCWPLVRCVSARMLKPPRP